LRLRARPRLIQERNPSSSSEMPRRRARQKKGWPQR
jgi:hypothetical protein